MDIELLFDSDLMVGDWGGLRSIFVIFESGLVKSLDGIQLGFSSSAISHFESISIIQSQKYIIVIMNISNINGSLMSIDEHSNRW